MNPIAIGMLVFACTLGGVLAGTRLRNRLPGHHLSDESKETVKLAIGLIATMTALVLGLVTASAKSAFDALDTAVKQTASEAIALDRTLARYGPETGEIRGALQQALAQRIEMTWPDDSSRPAVLDPAQAVKVVENIADRIRVLSPENDLQRALQARAVDLSEVLLEMRWTGLGSGSSIPPLFLAVLLLWLTIIFVSFGLFAPPNATVIGMLVVCALSVAAAIFLIYEMDRAFEGWLAVSADPLRFALAHMNR
jgi:hypothetical protein